MKQTIIIRNWSEINISPAGKNKFKAFCPNCHAQRKDKRDKSLSVRASEGWAFCHYCETTYLINNNKKPEYSKMETTNYTKPLWKNNTTLSTQTIKWFESRGINQETVREMKIGEGMEYMPQHNKEINTVQFNYFDQGRLVNTKFRSGAKYFKFVSGAELIPYNIDAVRNSPEVYITEGEMDALTLIQLGLPAISVPNGASDNTSYLNRFMEPALMDKERVYIAVDTDTKGVVLRDALVRRFGHEKCRVVESWGEGCKDANDCLVKHGAESLRILLSQAKEIPMPGISLLQNFEPDIDLLLDKGMEPGLAIGHPNFDEYCTFETKRMAVVTGIPGSGKSEFMDEIAVRMNIRHGWKFGYFSPENFPLKYHASKIISKISGKEFNKRKISAEEYHKVKEYMNENFFFITPDDNFTIDTILEKARYLVRRYGIRGLVLDPWNRFEHRIPAGMPETNYISEALDRISNFAQREDVLAFVVAHPSKQKKLPGSSEYEAPTPYDIAGSANFYNKPDYVLCVHRQKLAGYTEVHVQKVKFRHLGSTGMAMFKFNPFNGRYVPIDSATDAVVWENRSMI